MPARRSSPRILHRAWELRQATTKAETKLWAYLRSLKEGGIHFRRQHAIGRYIADFCAPRKNLVIEVDGIQHRSDPQPDAERTTYLTLRGYKVIRFTNRDVMNEFAAVMRRIEAALRKK